MVCTDICDCKMVDALGKPWKRPIHFVDQVENFKIGCLKIGMVTGILLMVEVSFR